MGLLDGKVALITGAGGGLGEAYAKLFAREGAAVVVNDLGGPRDGSGGDASMAQKVVDAIKAEGGRAVANGADISTIAGGQSVFDDAIKHFGRADILVNNAGILLDQTFAKATEAAWDKVLKVHLKGTFCVTQPVFQMDARERRRRHRQYLLDLGADRQFRPDQLWRRQRRHLGPVERAGDRGPQIQYPGLDAGSRRADPHDRRPAALYRESRRGIGPDGIAPAVLYMVCDLSGDQTGKVLGVSGPRGVREMRMMEMDGWKPPHSGWKAQDIVDHAGEIFFSEDADQEVGAAILNTYTRRTRTEEGPSNDMKTH